MPVRDDSITLIPTVRFFFFLIALTALLTNFGPICVALDAETYVSYTFHGENPLKEKKLMMVEDVSGALNKIAMFALRLQREEYPGHNWGSGSAWLQTSSANMSGPSEPSMAWPSFKDLPCDFRKDEFIIYIYIYIPWMSKTIVKIDSRERPFLEAKDVRHISHHVQCWLNEGNDPLWQENPRKI